MKALLLIDNTIAYLKQLRSNEGLMYQTRSQCLCDEIDRLEELRRDIEHEEDAE